MSITVEVFVNVSGHLVHMSQDMNGYSAVKVSKSTVINLIIDKNG